jgi:ABC-type methionine transport system ATPase subunit
MTVESRVKLTYPKELLHEPLLYHLIRDYDLVTNIIRANVGPDSGWLIISLRGEEAAIHRGLEWMTSQGVGVEPLSGIPEEK